MCSKSYQDCFPTKTVRFDVAAAGEPKPALKHRLFPPRFERKLGNAATVYRKAFKIVKELEENDNDRFESMKLLTHDEEPKKERWDKDNIPKELSPEEVAQFFEDYAELYTILDEASLCAECDWELSTEDLSWWFSDGEEGNFILHSRTISRLLTIRTSHALEQNDIELAIRVIQNHYAFVDHLLKIPMIHYALMASAIAGCASECVTKLILSGRSPNLYWALTQLPHFSDRYLSVVESERNCFSSYYPQLREIDDPARDNDHDYWKEFGEKFLVVIQSHLDLETEARIYQEVKAKMGKFEKEETLPLKEAAEKLQKEYLESAAEDYKNDPEGFEAYKKTLYPADPQTILNELPTIKQAVLDWGYAADRIERLCPEHLIAIYTVRVHEELFDEITKWHGVDYPTWQHFGEGIGRKQIEQAVDSYGTKLARMNARMLGGFVGYYAIAGADEEVSVLRILEAIRLYAASHDGKLPKNLKKITEVPIPLSPLTGKPFRYKIEKTKEGRIGVLEFSTHGCQEKRYEIRIVGL